MIGFDNENVSLGDSPEVAEDTLAELIRDATREYAYRREAEGDFADFAAHFAVEQLVGEQTRHRG